jgi:DNA-binding transcriptional ArsR family regulator
VPMPSPLPDPLVELIAERFRVIGEPLRIKLLDRLRAGEASVGELTDALGATQQNVSRHLAVLHAAGIVSRRKEGTRVVYGIADQTVFELCDAVCGSLQQSIAELAQLLGPAAPATGSRS